MNTRAVFRSDYKLSQIRYRGSEIVKLRDRDYQREQSMNLQLALNDEETGNLRERSRYRATAELEGRTLDQAMADCQTLAE